MIALGKAERVNLFLLRVHLPEPLGGPAGFVQWHVSDPIVDEFKTDSINSIRADVWHAAIALLGHSVKQYRPVRIARRNHPGFIKPEIALGRWQANQLGLLERQVIGKVKYRCSSSLMMAMSAIGVEVCASPLGQRSIRIVRLGQGGSWVGGGLGHDTGFLKLTGNFFTELLRREADDRAEALAMAELALGAAGKVPTQLAPASWNELGSRKSELAP